VRRSKRMAVATAAGLLLAGFVQADVRLFGARVTGDDVPRLVKFYESAFGLKEVNRVDLPNVFEVLMNFGDTVDAAKVNRGPQVVVMRRAPNAPKDPVAHLLLNVTDLNAAVAAVTAAGGSIQGKPFAFGKTGVLIVFASDPAGNQLEMIQPPKR